MKVFLLRKLLYYCLFAAMLFTTSIVKAQCPTVPNSFLSFCDLESPTVSSLIATNNGGGVSWYLSPVSTTPLAPTVGLINNQTYYADTNPPSLLSVVLVTKFTVPPTEEIASLEEPKPL